MYNFNCALRGDERSLGVGISSKFMSWVEQMGPVVLGFAGHISPGITGPVWKQGVLRGLIDPPVAITGGGYLEEPT